MSRSLGRGRLRRTAVLTTTLAMAAAGTLAAGGPAASAPSSDCPAPVAPGDLVRDEPVTGLTVSQGSTPEQFTGNVLGVIRDGLAPGVDMIMVRLTSPEIDRVGGIWAGMSGSPVYDADGNLIGAVAYGLALGPSPVAGVTPATEMAKLVAGGAAGAGAAAKTPERITIPDRAATRLVGETSVTARQAKAGFSRLPTPLAISGMASAKRLRQVSRRLKMTDAVPYQSGAASAAVETPAEAGIVPGGNLGVSLSYGDLSAVGFGTVTMVCGGDVVGFGHPMLWSGHSTMSVHGGDVVYVQEDPTLSPFKVTNPTGPVGTIDQDRFAGVSGPLGSIPDTSLVTSTVSAEGRSRTGTTEVTVPSWLPDLAASAVMSNQDRVFDELGEGSALVHTRVSGTADGKPFTLQRSNRYASAWDISWESAFEVFGLVSALENNRFTAVDIDSVDVSTGMKPTVDRYGIRSVAHRQGGRWVSLHKRQMLTARPGGTLLLRVTLGSFRDRLPVRHALVRVRVPGTTRPGSQGMLMVRGGNTSWWGSVKAKGFEDLVTSLENRVRNDQIVADLQLSGRRRASTASSTKSRPQPAVVGGRSWYRVRVRP